MTTPYTTRSDTTAAAGSASVGVTLGDGLGLISDSTLALLDTDNGELAERLWALMSSGSGVDDLLEELSATGLRSLGPFALAQFEDDGIRVVVRGAARAWVSSPGAEMHEYDADTVRTWLEHVEPGADAVVLSLRGDEPEQTPFRTASALLPAVCLRWPAQVQASGELVGLDASSVADGLLRLDRSGTVADPVGPGDSGSHTAGELEPDPQPESELAVAAEPEPTTEPEPDVAIEPEPTSASFDPPEQGDAAPNPSAADAPAADDSTTDTGDTIHINRYVEHDDQEDDPAVGGGAAGAPGHGGDEYDALWGHTVHRSVQDAAVESSDDDAGPGTPLIVGAPPSSPVVPPVDQLGDHDGLTMSAAQLRALRDQAGVAPTPASNTAPLGGPTVQAIVCRAGHHNPPHLSLCRVCGQQLDGTPITIARPRLGTIRFSTGDLVELDRPAILGRNPKIEGQFPNELPQTVVIDAGKAVSRSHLLIRLEGWQVWVEDLGSANGTTITLPGQAPQRLRSGEPFLLEAGARINLGDEVDGTFEAS